MRISDWSSDVCSSDLQCARRRRPLQVGRRRAAQGDPDPGLGQAGGPRARPEDARARGPRQARRIARGARELHQLRTGGTRSEEHTSELQSLMRISYAVFCLKKKKKRIRKTSQKE